MKIEINGDGEYFETKTHSIDSTSHGKIIIKPTQKLLELLHYLENCKKIHGVQHEELEKWLEKHEKTTLNIKDNKHE